MPSFNTEVANPVSKDQAVSQLKGLLEKVRARYQDQVSDMQESWNGDNLDFSFKAYGFTIKGVVTVAEEAVRVVGDLPFAAVMFRGKIEESIRSEIDKTLHKGKEA
jgi:hypothetical protein